jgi:nucleoside phosphorylase
MRTLFLFATLAEAKISIERVGANLEEDGVYAFGEHKIVIIGMGPKNASLAVEKLPTDGVKWVNIGIAGALDPSLFVGHPFSIGTTAFLHENRIYDRQIIDRNVDTILYTSSVPVYERPPCCEGRALIDMEGHAVAKIALQKNVPLSFIKVVSDYCSKDTHRLIKERLPELSKTLSLFLEDT